MAEGSRQWLRSEERPRRWGFTSRLQSLILHDRMLMEGCCQGAQEESWEEERRFKHYPSCETTVWRLKPIHMSYVALESYELQGKMLRQLFQGKQTADIFPFAAEHADQRSNLRNGLDQQLALPCYDR